MHAILHESLILVFRPTFLINAKRLNLFFSPFAEDVSHRFICDYKKYNDFIKYFKIYIHVLQLFYCTLAAHYVRAINIISDLHGA